MRGPTVQILQIVVSEFGISYLDKVVDFKSRIEQKPISSNNAR